MSSDLNSESAMFDTMDTLETLTMTQGYQQDIKTNNTRIVSSSFFSLKSDPRVEGMLLMDSVWPTILLTLAYLLIILEIGPKFMKNRSAYELRYPMMVYNLFQTMFSLWMFAAGLEYYLSGHYSLVCQPVDYSYRPRAMRALHCSWWYYFSKFIDFMDSFFFVLRKKDNQLTPLHIIHHSTMPFFCWFGPKFAGGGNSFFGPTLNMGVHTVMYLYYFLAATGFRKEHLWWKRYVTQLQLTQFALVILHSLGPFILEDCNFPKEISALGLVVGPLFMVLFTSFYRAAYKQEDKKIKAE